jgi:hypothetical protein
MHFLSMRKAMGYVKGNGKRNEKEDQSEGGL